MRGGLILAALLACTSCSVIEQPSGPIARWTTAWKDVATKDDRARLTDWRTNFIQALDAAKKAGHGSQIEREGVLLEPDAALDSPDIPNGMYRCRVIKLGAKPGTGDRAFFSTRASACRVRVDRDLQRFNKFEGPQRYAGLIFPGDSVRRIFLGTLVLGDEMRALQYGQDEYRDVAGYVERIGPQRWRILMPKPHFESEFDVMELVPASSPRCVSASCPD